MKAMKVALVSSGSRGDLQPMVELGRRLIARGHEARCFISPNGAFMAEAAGVPFTLLGEDVEKFAAGIPDPTAAPVGAGRALLAFVRREIETQHRVLPALLEDYRQVIAATFGIGARDVAEGLGVSYAYVLYAAQMLRSREHPPVTNETFGLPGFVNAFSWSLSNAMSNFMLLETVNVGRKRFGLTPTGAMIADATTKAGVRAVVARGWARLECAEGDNVFVLDSTPHAVLFPRLAGVVHHGGAGTTAAAARAGLPQLIVPHMTDQFYFAHHLPRLGLGPPSIPRKRMTAGKLAQAIKALVGEPSFRARAQEVAQTIASTAPDLPETLIEQGAFLTHNRRTILSDLVIGQ